MFKHILVPTDGSELSSATVARAQWPMTCEGLAGLTDATYSRSATFLPLMMSGHFWPSLAVPRQALTSTRSTSPHRAPPASRQRYRAGLPLVWGAGGAARAPRATAAAARRSSMRLLVQEPMKTLST